MRKIRYQLFFIFCLTIVALFYNYQEILFKRPQSIHAWRQADGASVTLNYSREGMQFFQPSFHNMTSDGGTSGKSATSEMPLLYYAVAVLYTIFGQHEFLFRLLNSLLFFTGLFYLFRTIRLLFKDYFWAIAIPLFLFSSPVLVYYANNFLPYSAAFAMVLIGWFFAFRYFQNQKRLDLQKMFLFFLLAGALKITALFSFFALAAIFLLEWSSLIKFRKGRKLFPAPGLTLIAGIVSLLPIVAWIIYAKHYNNLHDSKYFSTVLFPFWQLEPENIRHILKTIREQWLPHYYHPLSLIFLALLLLVNLIFAGRNRRLYNLLMIFLFLEVVIYVLLQFWFFRDHDYYTLNIYILAVILIISSLHLLKSLDLSRSLSIAVKIIFGAFLVFNIVYARENLEARYELPLNKTYHQMKDFYTIEPHLRKTGIQSSDRVISFSDYSHISLYLMDQKGWSRFTDMRLGREDPIPYNNDSAAIQRSIDHGAKYLIINGIEDLYMNPLLQPFTTNLKSTYRSILIFDLTNPLKNFALEDRKEEEIAFSSGEILTADSSLFLDTLSGKSFKNDETLSTRFALSGVHSVALNHNKPYGFSTTLENMKHGESVKVKVWKKDAGLPGGIVVQSEDYHRFNRSDSHLTGRRKGQWVELELEFFVPFGFDGENIKVYVYNPDAREVYFDDFSIVRYESVLGE